MNAKLAVTAGALLLGVVALVPYIAGRQVEQDVRAGIARYNNGQHLVAVTLERYDRAWLRSEFVAKLTWKDDDADLARITTSMKHAPLAGLDFVSGEAQVHLPEASAATEQYYFDGQAPITVAFGVARGGAASGAIRSAAVDKAIVKAPKSRVLLAASEGSFSLRSDGTFRLDWRVPRVEVSAPEMAVALEGIAISAFGRLADEDFAAASGLTASVQSYRAKTGTHAVDLARVAFTSSLTPSADSIRIALGLSLGPGTVDGLGQAQRWESFELRSSLSNVPRAALAAYASEMNGYLDAGASRNQRTVRALAAASEFAAALAQAEPLFAIDKLDLRAPGGTFAASLKVRLDKSRWLSETDSWGLVNAISMDGRVSVSRALALDLIGSTMRGDTLVALRAEGGEPSAESVKAASNRHAERAFNELVLAGFVKEGDTIDLDLVARNGALTINGVPASHFAIR